MPRSRRLARMITMINLSVVAGGMLVLLTAEVSAQTPPGTEPPPPLVVTPGSDPTATLLGAVRFRNLPSAGTENEIWVGVPPLSAPPASAGSDLSWGTGQNIGVAYSPVSGLLAAAAVINPDGPGVPVTVGYVEKFIGDLGSLNYIEITITQSVPDAHFLFSGVLDPPGLGPQPPGGGAGSCLGCLGVFAPGTSGTYKWKVTGIDFTDGFSLNGWIKATDLLAGGDSDFVEIAVGYVPPPDTTGPTSSNLTVGPTPVLLNGYATLTAVVDDSATGNNGIGGAFYTVGTSAYATGGPLTALDGSFDEPSENVQATFSVTQLGIHEVCVQGTDSLNNIGPAICQQFVVTHKFTGFFNPIDNTLVNGAVAGQTLPARWGLADANDVPVSDPATVQQLTSYQISCADLSEDYSDSIEEYAAGSSGLRYLGEGQWQFNWKTPANYANTCRAMYIAFASGATSPVVKFSFK